jgi:Leucine-rich repeat (LRR) protein
MRDARYMQNVFTNVIVLHNCVLLHGESHGVLDFSEGFPKLYEVHVNGMELTDLSRQVRFPDHIGTLGFSDNHIRDGHGVVWPSKLRTIFLDYNGIESLASFKFPDFMQQLNVTGNKITGFSGFSAPHQLNTVYADKNQIVHLDLNPLQRTGLSHVNVSGNKIETVTGIISVPMLYNLELNNNPFEELPVMYGDLMYSRYVPRITFDGCPLSLLGEKRAQIFKPTAGQEQNQWRTLVLRYNAIILVHEVIIASPTVAVHVMPLELIRTLVVQYL